jgi:hypothetical protein
MAYWPGCFMVTAGFLGLLIAAYWPGLMWLTGLAYCNTLSAYWSRSHPAYPRAS